MNKKNNKPVEFPEQEQVLPGAQYKMEPEPEVIRENYKGSEKLKNKVAIITGGDSGIGRSVAVHFAREGADCVVIYLSEHKDAEETRELVEKEGRKCITIAGDIGDREFCSDAVEKTFAEFGKINILINNAGEQHPADNLQEIDFELMEKTFRTNVFGMFYLSKDVLQYMHQGDSIINSTSVTSYRGSSHLLDYSSTKGAITAFTRSLSENLASKKIRVNGVAPGPIWTPLIPSTFDDVTKFGQDTALGRAGQPSEVAPAYVFLASEDASYIMGQIIHINGGDFVSS
jgi:NAD(P)-dependent dehydrogenase (short-subunit alcohol dehydrogenase family)